MIENTEQVANTAYAVTAVVLLLTCARFVLRRLKHERIYPDDWLMVVAFFLMGGFASTFPVLVCCFLIVPKFHILLTYYHSSTQGQESMLTQIPKLSQKVNANHPLQLIISSNIQTAEFDSKYIMFGRIAYLSYIWSLKVCIVRCEPTH